MLRPGTCYARPIDPQSNTRHIYEGGYGIKEVIQENTHVHRCLVAEDLAGMFHARSTGRWSVRATYGEKKKTTGHRISSPVLRRSFPSPSPSCARVVVSNVSSMAGTDVPDQCRIHRCCRCCCCCSLTPAKWCRSCWSPLRVVRDIIWVCWVLCFCCGRM